MLNHLFTIDSKTEIVKGKLEISEDTKRTDMFSEINYLLEHQILSILKNKETFL